MNARQRRQHRRARGIRPPYRCLWCETTNAALGRCGGCGTVCQPVGDLTLEELGRKAWERGMDLRFEIRKRA